MEANQEMDELNEDGLHKTDKVNNHGGLVYRQVEKTKNDANYRNSLDLELINEKYEVEKMIRRPSVIPKSPTLTSEEFNEYSDMFKDMPLTEETTCGIWFFKGALLQKFANKKVYVVLYGLLGCFNSATYAYFNGTITTLEKRYRIPSRTTGLISVGNDISQIFVSILLSYYAGKGHRPRWIAFGTFSNVLFCMLTALPHLLYGAGADALQLTYEFGGSLDDNETQIIMEAQKQKTLCQLDGPKCIEEDEGSFYPQLILFLAQFIGGVGGSLYYSLGVAYMDDNIQKSKTPVLISFSYFLRMLGPAIGYALASFCLKAYISPSLTPTITMNDPRWLGAWWIGWVMLGSVIALFGFLIGLFPKTLPRAAVRRAIALEKNKGKEQPLEEEKASLADMWVTIKRLVKNNTYVCNNFATIFYCLGYMPYWIFMPKYIEIQYKQSASTSSFITGTVGLVFSAIGVLVSGLMISRYRPRARILAGWNVFVGAASVIGLVTYMFLGCDVATQGLKSMGGLHDTPCNTECHCDYVPYSPVCSEQKQSFISPCHAGCRDSYKVNGSRVYTDCSCVLRTPENSTYESGNSLWGTAVSENCPIDCKTPFYIFLGVVCILKFVGATGRSSNFLVGVRCIDEADKSAAMGFSVTILSLFALVPSPIIFGYILDSTCMVWGKTCASSGNCWLYNSEELRYTMNLIAAILVGIGTLFDGAVWYYAKNLKIFDDDVDVKTVGAGSAGD